jgi:hypothetical protein
MDMKRRDLNCDVQYLVLCCVTLCCIMLCYVTFFYVVCYVMLCCVLRSVMLYVKLCCVRLCYDMLHYVILCYVTFCYAMLCYVTKCNVMMCYILCYFMLCYDMLRYFMLCTEERGSKNGYYTIPLSVRRTSKAGNKILLFIYTQPTNRFLISCFHVSSLNILSINPSSWCTVRQSKIRSTFFYFDITFVSCRRNLWAGHNIQLLKSSFQLPHPPPTDDRWGNLEKAGGAARYYSRLREPRPCKEPPYSASSLTLCLAVRSSDKWISSDLNKKT